MTTEKYMSYIDLKLAEQIYDLMGIADENEIQLKDAMILIIEYIDNIFEREQNLDDEIGKYKIER